MTNFKTFCVFVMCALVFITLFAVLDAILPDNAGGIVASVMLGMIIYDVIRSFLIGIKKRIEAEIMLREFCKEHDNDN